MVVLREDLFFFFAVMNCVVVGVTILGLMVLSHVINCQFVNVDYFAGGIGFYLVVSSVCLLWLRGRFFAELEREEFLAKYIKEST
jgi:hypothetical protein